MKLVWSEIHFYIDRSSYNDRPLCDESIFTVVAEFSCLIVNPVLLRLDVISSSNFEPWAN